MGKGHARSVFDLPDHSPPEMGDVVVREATGQGKTVGEIAPQNITARGAGPLYIAVYLPAGGGLFVQYQNA